MNVHQWLRMVLFLPTFLCFAQPVITSTDVLKLVNGSGIWEGGLNNTIPIDLKNEGPDQIWDFRETEMGNTIEQEDRLNNKEESPYSDQYPKSDYVLTNIMVSDPAYKVYTYFKVTEERLQIIARVVDNAGDISFSHTHADH